MNDPKQLNIDLSSVDSIVCDNCENDNFSPTFIIKKISPLMSPSGKETLIPLQVFKCEKCNHINELFLKGLTN